MFVNEFRKELLPLSSIQFATGIALDNLNEIPLAKLVIQMYNYKTIDAYVGTTFPTRESLSNYLSKQGNGLVKDFIHYLYTDNCIYDNNGKKLGMYAKKSFTSLQSIAHRISEATLMHEVMKIILNNNPNNFIYLFAKSTIFKRELSGFLWKNFYMSADGTRRNVYSQDIINSVLNSFTEYVEKYSANGSYNPESGTPVNFLINTFQNFYRPKGDVYNILNTKSVLDSVSKNNSLSLSDYMTTEHTEDLSIDFINLASKIGQSSYSLYNHNGDGGIAYYDIFSWYRDMIADQLYKKYRPFLEKSLRGIDISRPTIMEEVEGTKRDKGGRRNKLCEVYYRTVSDGMNVSDIYSLYVEVAEKSYELCNHRNSSGGASDGSTYYEWKELTSKSKTSNADKFKYDYEGFIALKTLVDFLNSPSNNTGITIFNMPVAIFRDKRLIRRFNSFSEYIGLYSDVTTLMNEVDIDSGRSVVVDVRRVWNNDSVFDCLLRSLNNENIQNREILSKVFRTPLSLGGTVISNEKEAKAETLRKEIYNIHRSWDDSQVLMPLEFKKERLHNDIGQYLTMQDKLKRVLSSFMYLCKEFQKDNSAYRNYALSFCTMNLIEEFLLTVQTPLLDVNGYYQLSNKTLNDIIQAVKLPQQYSKFIMYPYERSIAILLAIQKNTWEDLRNAMTCAKVMQSFINNLSTMFNDLDQELLYNAKGDNLYLVYAKLAALYPILDQKWDIERIKDLKMFFEDETVLLPLDINQLPLIQYKSVEDTRNKNLVAALRAYMKLFSKQEVTFISKLNGKIDTILSTTEDVMTVDTGIFNLLARANLSIYATKMSTQYQQQLESFCMFNESGFVMKNGRLFTFRTSKEYIHHCGYIITIIQNEQMPFKITELNDETIAKIKLMYLAEV